MGNTPFQRETTQRRVILEELCTLTSHPTAGMLHAIVRRRLPRISLGTVYRNLELLARSGAVRRLELGTSEARFDGDLSPHDHVRCLDCGRVDDIPLVPLDLSTTRNDDDFGYEIVDRRLELLGFCPQCRKRAARQARRGGTSPPRDIS